MDFEHSEEDAMIADSVDLFGARHYPASGRLKTLAAGEEPSRARWKEMAELGWLDLGLSDGIRTPADDGYVMMLMQGFGRHLMLEPFVTRCVLAPALLQAGEGQGAALLPAIAEGRALVSLALGEPDARFSLDHVEMSAERRGSGFSLSGRKDHAVDGADAEWFVVPARTGSVASANKGISLFLVHRDAAGLSIERFRSIDHHRHARLRLADVAVERDALIGPIDKGLPILEAAVDRAIAAHLAEALGSMEAVAAVTLEHLRTRKQFGKAIGTFQVLQHRMVDVHIACEEARSMVYHATASLSAAPGLRSRAIAAAKTRVGQCGLFVSRQAVQLHGGLGMSAELIVSHHLKRQMMLDIAYGSAAHHRARFVAAAPLAA